MSADRSEMIILLIKQIRGQSTEKEDEYFLSQLPHYSEQELISIFNEARSQTGQEGTIEEIAAGISTSPITSLYKKIASEKLPRRRNSWLGRNRRMIATVLLVLGLGALLTWLMKPDKEEQKPVCDLHGPLQPLSKNYFEGSINFGENLTRSTTSFEDRDTIWQGFRLYTDESGTLHIIENTDSLLQGGSGTILIGTAEEKTLRVQIPGGVGVWLNASSYLRFTKDANGSRLQLGGEAKVDMYDTTGLALRIGFMDGLVEMQNATVYLEGYSENISIAAIKGKAVYHRDSVSYSIAEGKLLRILEPAQSPLNKEQIIEKAADSAHLLNWQYTVRSYDSIPQRDLLVYLARWYGLELKCLENVSLQKLSMKYCVASSKEEVITMLADMGLQFRREGDLLMFCR